ncbi:ribonuclease P protein component [Nibricoccus sp. IMCC34717]|uniref:ribonuclease P protein component n=1 Tax=Nibricoccus sp. IMCC34717 TaxID=3034021 RepID=UPI00384FCFAE
MRFRPEHHVRRQRDFQLAREQGRRLECGGFTLWYRRREPTEAPECTNARVGVVASIASVGGSVQRSRAKRRLREVFRKNLPLVPGDHDLLLVARRSCNATKLPELERRFQEACRRLFP